MEAPSELYALLNAVSDVLEKHFLEADTGQIVYIISLIIFII